MQLRQCFARAKPFRLKNSQTLSSFFNSKTNKDFEKSQNFKTWLQKIQFGNPECSLQLQIWNWYCERSCQIFLVAYGQNPDKKWPKWLFFQKCMAKITDCFNYGNFYIHRCLKFFGNRKAVYWYILNILPYDFRKIWDTYEYRNYHVLFAEKMWFCQRSKFLP